MKRIFYLFPVLFLLVGCSSPTPATGISTLPSSSTQQTQTASHPTHLVYAVAQIPTPVIDIPNFPLDFGAKDGKSLNLDQYGQVNDVEFIALPQTVFTIVKIIPEGKNVSYQVTTNDYPYPTDTGYFIDSRFVKLTSLKPMERTPILPSKKQLIANLLKAKGSNYIWGGDVYKGVPQLLSFFPPAGKISADLQKRWMLTGVDCSGLLYEATNGYTPRNTSSLITFGTGVDIYSLNADAIDQKLQPLDLIVWSGHLIIVLPNEQTIESRVDFGDGLPGGVRVRPLKTVLDETLKTRTPVNIYDKTSQTKQFVVRRWYI